MIDCSFEISTLHVIQRNSPSIMSIQFNLYDVMFLAFATCPNPYICITFDYLNFSLQKYTVILYAIMIILKQNVFFIVLVYNFYYHDLFLYDESTFL